MEGRRVFAFLVSAIVPLAAACGGSSGPPWEKDLLAVLCGAQPGAESSRTVAARFRPPFLISPKDESSTVEFVEGEGRSRPSILCTEADSVSDAVTIDDIKILGTLARLQVDDVHVLAVARKDESFPYGWVQVTDSSVEQAEAFLEHPFDWSDVPVVEYRPVSVGRPNLIVSGAAESSPLEGTPCVLGSRVTLPAGSEEQVLVSNQGAGAVESGLKLDIDGARLSVLFRRPMESGESFSFVVANGTTIAIDPANVIAEEVEDYDNVHRAASQGTELACKP